MGKYFLGWLVGRYTGVCFDHYLCIVQSLIGRNLWQTTTGLTTDAVTVLQGITGLNPQPRILRMKNTPNRRKGPLLAAH